MTRVRVVIQCRVSSSRLPGKAMLTLGGMPVVVLVARRAARGGYPVVIATSTDRSDDCIESVARGANIPVVRGPLQDVLGRFVLATADLANEDLVVRLTADNVVPDDDLIDEAVHASAPGCYLGTNSPEDGTPYGLSVETFSVGALRAAHAETNSAYDREHVTPFIRRTKRAVPFIPKCVTRDRSFLRCTLDTIHDYERLASLFATVSDPVGVHHAELVECLAALPGAPTFAVGRKRTGDGALHGELALGAVQLGLPYGAANVTGQPSVDESGAIVRTAIAHGVTAIDTARAYGSSEAVLGEVLAAGLGAQVVVVTKLSPLADLPDDASPEHVARAVDASVLRSCRELRLPRLPVLLLHRWKHRSQFGGAIWERLLRLAEEGLIGKLGASVANPEEALEAIADPSIEHLQLPFNVLDHRWTEAGIPEKVAGRSRLVVHARSSLLQGILGAGIERWPTITDPRPFVDALDTAARALGRADRVDLSLAYVRAQPWITSTLVGFETLAQLCDGLERFRAPALTAEECARLRSMLPRAPDDLLDPARWKR